MAVSVYPTALWGALNENRYDIGYNSRTKNSANSEDLSSEDSDVKYRTTVSNAVMDAGAIITSSLPTV